MVLGLIVFLTMWWELFVPLVILRGETSRLKPLYLVLGCRIKIASNEYLVCIVKMEYGCLIQ